MVDLIQYFFVKFACDSHSITLDNFIFFALISILEDNYVDMRRPLHYIASFDIIIFVLC